MNPSSRFFSLPTYVWLQRCFVAAGYGELVTCPNAGTVPNRTHSMSSFSRQFCSDDLARQMH